MGFLENGAAGDGAWQRSKDCAVKLTFGLLTDLVTRLPSLSGFVLLLQISTFALPVIQGLPGDPSSPSLGVWLLLTFMLDPCSTGEFIIIPTAAGLNGFKTSVPRASP
jgi:hypothetical protein